MRAFRWSISALTLACCAGCAAPLAVPEPEAEQLRALQLEAADDSVDWALDLVERLLPVTTAIRRTGSDLCGELVAPVIGVETIPLGESRSEFLDAIRRRFAVRTNGLLVLSVSVESPAHRAGVEAGDLLLAVNDRPIPTQDAMLEIVHEQRDRAPSLRVGRGPDELELVLDLMPGCLPVVEVLVDERLTTGPLSGGHGFITTELMEWVEGEDELAILVAHEIAHRVIAKMGDRKAAAYSRVEFEADRLGLELAFRGGFDVRRAPRLWRRLALEQPWLIEKADAGVLGHDWIAARLPHIQETLRELSEGRLDPRTSRRPDWRRVGRKRHHDHSGISEL